MEANALKAAPRIVLYPKRHAKLAAEARKRKMAIKDIAEEKFLAAEGHVEE